MHRHIQDHVEQVKLVDHHCHFVLNHDLDRETFEDFATESEWPPPAGTSVFDSPIGTTIRAECAPLLDLARNSSPDEYIARRNELGYEEVSRRLLGDTRTGTLIVETGLQGPKLVDLDDMVDFSGARTETILRLEYTAETLLSEDFTADRFIERFQRELDSGNHIGYKTVVAYRGGLDFDPQRPSHGEVVDAIRALEKTHTPGTRLRLADQVIIRHLIWSAIDMKKPLQVHVGYGDGDITLHKCDPTQMTEFVQMTRESGSKIMLLHCYPFQREAAFLAQIYPHVYLDTGVAIAFAGPGSLSIVRESMEIAPFFKLLYSSDAYGLPEIYQIGAALWRKNMATILSDWLADGAISLDDAKRYIDMVAFENANRVYEIGGQA